MKKEIWTGEQGADKETLMEGYSEAHKRLRGMIERQAEEMRRVREEWEGVWGQWGDSLWV